MLVSRFRASIEHNRILLDNTQWRIWVDVNVRGIDYIQVTMAVD